MVKCRFALIGRSAYQLEGQILLHTFASSRPRHGYPRGVVTRV